VGFLGGCTQKNPPGFFGYVPRCLNPELNGEKCGNICMSNKKWHRRLLPGTFLCLSTNDYQFIIVIVIVSIIVIVIILNVTSVRTGWPACPTAWAPPRSDECRRVIRSLRV